jgi:GH18 family chitinase
MEVEACCSQNVVLCPAGNNPLAKQHVVVCYVAGWARWRPGPGSFTVDNIDPTLCTHLVYAFANLNIAKNAIESNSPEYDLDENSGTGWCIVSTVWIVVCANLSQVQEVQ